MTIRIGTRQSPLAMWQAQYVSAQLEALGYSVELVKITTAGDTLATPLIQGGGVGLFTKEIQKALLDGRCDVAVHSLKDLPTAPVPGLALTAVPPREDPADCLISNGDLSLTALPLGAVVGTGSPRRRAQLRSLRPDLQLADIRGNVATRIDKLSAGEFDAIVLAYAGLHRLGLDSRISEKLSLKQILPAVGQAALGLETREDDTDSLVAIQGLDHLPTHAAVRCERGLLRGLKAGCLAPVATHATYVSEKLSVECLVFSPDHTQRIRSEGSLDCSAAGELLIAADTLAEQVLDDLRRQGAYQWIER